MLDLCSGIGSTSRLIASKYDSNVISVDLIDELVQVNQVMNDLCQYNKIKTVESDATQLDLVALDIEGKCDLLLSIQSFLYVHDKKGLFNLCNRALKPGGYLYIEDHIGINSEPLPDELDRISKDFGLVRVD